MAAASARAAVPRSRCCRAPTTVVLLLADADVSWHRVDLPKAPPRGCARRWPV
jgi:hypothetical protein